MQWIWLQKNIHPCDIWTQLWQGKQWTHQKQTPTLNQHTTGAAQVLCTKLSHGQTWPRRHKQRWLLTSKPETTFVKRNETQDLNTTSNRKKTLLISKNYQWCLFHCQLEQSKTKTSRLPARIRNETQPTLSSVGTKRKSDLETVIELKSSSSCTSQLNSANEDVKRKWAGTKTLPNVIVRKGNNKIKSKGQMKSTETKKGREC